MEVNAREARTLPGSMSACVLAYMRICAYAHTGGEGVNTRPRCRILIGQQGVFKNSENGGHRTEQVVGVGAMWWVDKV
jgi:hypothetical protein